MTRFHRSTAVAASLLLAAGVAGAEAQDANRVVAGGGITVEGWAGKVDAAAAAAGETVNNAKLAMQGDALHIMTGPAVTYWNPANVATGDYTVKATFTEPQYMNLNDHPHPYGIVIAGNDLGTDQQSLLYCAANGNGSFIMRGFGPEPFQLNGRRAVPHDAINKAAGKNQPVTQEIAVSVRGDKIECAINGTVVGSYDKAAVVADGRLKSTAGVYGIRAAHNTEVLVTGLSITKH